MIVGKDMTDNFVACTVCGYTKKCITQHLRLKHPEINIEHYKEKYPVISPESRKAYSNAVVSLYEADSTRRERVSKTVKSRYDDPKEREKTSNAAKAAYVKSPGLRQKMSEAQKNSYAANPERKSRISSSLKEAYKDETLCAKLSDLNRLRYTEDPNLSARQSASMKKRYEEDPSLKQRISNGIKARYQNDPNLREKVSATVTERYKNPEAREKASKSAAKAISEGRRNNNQYKSGWLDTRFGVFNFRSSYEEYFLQLANADETITALTYEKVTIPYMRAEFEANYVPDYEVTTSDGSKYLVEIKPAVRVKECDEKTKAAISWCLVNGYTYVILTETELCNSATTTFPWVTEGATTVSGYQFKKFRNQMKK